MEEKKLTDEEYRKILDGVMEQAEKDFGKDINVPNKTELSDEEIVKALECCVEGGRCGECPYHINKIDCVPYQRSEKDTLDLIHRLQSENATLKTELRKECEEHEEFTKKAKEEIEFATKVISMSKRKTKIADLLKEIDYLKNCADNFLADYQKAQKQVDELEQELENKKAEEGEIYKWAKNNILGGGGMMSSFYLEFTDEEIKHICLAMISVCEDNTNEEAVAVFKNIMNKAERHLLSEDKEIMRIMKMIKGVE